MRKIIVQFGVSLDGFMEGPNREIDWHMVDEEFNRYAIDTIRQMDTLLFGRVTYQLFESYWPSAAKDPKTSPHDLEIARLFNNMSKVVFSKTLKKVEWENSRLVRDVVAEDILKMKRQPGKDMSVGGAALIQRFTELGLIDEYRLLVHPLLLGSGKRLFKEDGEKRPLKLMGTKTFGSGVVALTYQPG